MLRNFDLSWGITIFLSSKLARNAGPTITVHGIKYSPSGAIQEPFSSKKRCMRAKATRADLDHPAHSHNFIMTFALI